MKFSIITPCLEQLDYLPKCIESVRCQLDGSEHNLKPCIQIEHIVQDGGSKNWDNYYNQLDEQSTKTTNYELLLFSGPDGGQTYAINKGLEKSSGEILAYLCADDFYEAGTLEKVAEVFKKYPEVDVVYGDGYFIEGDSGWKRLKTAGAFSIERLKSLNFIIQPATFWRRRVYDRFGPLDSTLQFCMDNEYWLRISDHVNWFYLDAPLAAATMHQDAKTSSQLVDAWQETAIMAERYGLGKRYARYARQMKLYGAGWYRFKRGIFFWLGKVMAVMRMLPKDARIDRND